MQLLPSPEPIPELYSTCHPQHLPCLLTIPSQHPAFVLLARNPHPPHPPRSLGGPTLSARVSGPGTWERASAVLVRTADPELPQQQQLYNARRYDFFSSRLPLIPEPSTSNVAMQAGTMPVNVAFSTASTAAHARQISRFPLLRWSKIVKQIVLVCFGFCTK